MRMKMKEEFVERDYLGPAEFARRIGKSREFVYKYMKLGRIHATKLGTAWLIPVTELEALARRVAAQPVNDSGITT
jgi:excisionase family DNA binding protein